MKFKVAFIFYFVTVVTLYFICFTIFEKIAKDFLKVEENVCSQFPQEKDLLIDSEVWQVFDTINGSVKLINAFLDERWNLSVVRINSNGPVQNLTRDKIYCQYFFENQSHAITVEASEIQSLWVKRKCKTPDELNEKNFVVNFNFPRRLLGCAIQWEDPLHDRLSIQLL